MKHVVVGCSGGPDSQVLLHVLHALQAEHGCSLYAASVDHGLRAGAASERALARELAQSLSVPFIELRVEVAAGPSLQAAARTARYAALLAFAREQGAECVAVGHTRDDQAETVLARLVRGAGIAGLAAISPRRADGVVRPLIDCARADVHAYARTAELPHAHDPSNSERRFLRVRVREQLLPLLEREDPQVVRHVADLADDARDAAALLRSLAQQARVRMEGQVARLREEPALLRRWVLRQLVEENTGAALARTHVTALDRMLWRGGEVRVPGDAVVSIAHSGELAIARVAKRGRGVPRPTEETGRNVRR